MEQPLIESQENQQSEIGESENLKEPAVIGRVAATKFDRNKSREFYFWIEPKTQVNPLDLIVVDEEIDVGEDKPIQRKVYAQILDIESYTDAESFLDVFASTNFGDTNLDSEVKRLNFCVAKAQVLRTSINNRMPVQFNSSVALADAEAIRELLRVDENIKDKLPIGYIEQSNAKETVYMSAKWLTGPAGAHLNVSGKSRLAAKTSYVLFLISSILQTQLQTQEDEDTAVIIFNVKASDLLQIHEPTPDLAVPSDDLDDNKLQEIEKLKTTWQDMGLEAKPFDKDKVVYLLPAQRHNPNGINADLRNLPNPESSDITDQPPNYFVYRYALPDVRGRLRFLLPHPESSEPQQHLIAALDNHEDSPAETMPTFLGLCNALNGRILNADARTVSVVKRSIEDVTNNRTSGVFGYQESSFASQQHQLPSTFINESLQAGQILVVDIANVNEHEKRWVFGDVIEAVDSLMAFGTDRDESKPKKPKKVVIFVDELNKYAPSGRSSPLTERLLEITSAGGGLGVILFGAEQFASRIHPQVYGNCTNRAFGLTDPTESATEPYRAFPREIRDRLSELEVGELLINYDYFGMPLRIKFPPPVCRKQEDADQ